MTARRSGLQRLTAGAGREQIAQNRAMRSRWIPVPATWIAAFGPALRVARRMLGAMLVAGLVTAPVAAAPPATPAPPAASAGGAERAPPPSSMARRLYDQHKAQLVQIRVLVAGSDSQSSAGSAFAVSADGLLVTNYHVVSPLVNEPEQYRAEFARTDGRRGAIALLAIDVQHDLAVVRALDGPGPVEAWEPMELAPDDALRQGDKVFSLGNPLDLGFAISEGTYNGSPERSLYPHLMFTGAMNPGVSGGPALDDSGRVVGVNVAGYGRGAELTNFQVPVRFVRELLVRARARHATRQPVAPAELKADMRQQLLAHQARMLDGLNGQAWKTQALGPYRVPVIPETLARCWGDISSSPARSFRLESVRCNLDSSRFISGTLDVGSVTTQHEVLSSEKLWPLRLARLRAQSLNNEAQRLGVQTRERTAARCRASFVRRGEMPLRVAVCVRAYRKLEGLYDISTTVVTLDHPQQGLESALHLRGVDHARGLQEAQRFVEAIARSRTP